MPKIFLEVDQENSHPAFLRIPVMGVALTNDIISVFHAYSPQKVSFIGVEHKDAFYGGFDLLSREVDREILTLGPWFEQVFVMETFWVSGLTRAVRSDRVVPIATICNDAKRGA